MLNEKRKDSFYNARATENNNFPLLQINRLVCQKGEQLQ